MINKVVNTGRLREQPNHSAQSPDKKKKKKEEKKTPVFDEILISKMRESTN